MKKFLLVGAAVLGVVFGSNVAQAQDVHHYHHFEYPDWHELPYWVRHALRPSEPSVHIDKKMRPILEAILNNDTDAWDIRQHCLAAVPGPEFMHDVTPESIALSERRSACNLEETKAHTAVLKHVNDLTYVRGKSDQKEQVVTCFATHYVEGEAGWVDLLDCIEA